MDSPIKVFILGSCVSRDPFEIADKRDFEIVSYYARSSFASLGASAYIDKKLLNEVGSSWQRRMVYADMSKSVFTHLTSVDYDILLLDLIDERFSLSIFENSIHTISSEYKKALYKPNQYGFVRANSDEKLALWKSGLKKLSNYLIKKGLDSKVVVNKVYWSLNCEGKEKLLDRYNEGSVKIANEQLKWMYSEIEKAIPNARFITYTDNELELDEQHKWGLEPFHYSKKAFIKQLNTLFLFSLRNLKFTIKHVVGEKSLNFPINWRINPFDSRPWMHHFMSLRWLDSKFSYLFIANTLVSFYKYHCEKKTNNPYYNSIRGDHTAAIRLDVFCNIMKEYQNHDLPTIKNITNRLIIEEVKNLQCSHMYRAGHNHGLMVDLALLNLIKNFPEYKRKVNIELVLLRSGNTVNAMWHASGLTKEHSISYQEYNIPLTADYFFLLQEMKLKAYTSIDLNNVLDESKRFLGYALKSNGEYFPLGDSFRLPNKKILKNIYGLSSDHFDNAHELLSPYSYEDGIYANNHFFIYRRTIDGKKIHFVATCCWDSHNHKQNDELSFCLDVDGTTIFDDPGYTEFTDWQSILDLKSESQHTTINIGDKAWDDVLHTNNKSKVIVGYVGYDGFDITMEMERYKGIRFIRNISFKKGVFEISDKAVSKASLLTTRFNRVFVFGSDMDIELKNENHSVFYLYDKKSKKEVAEFHSVSDSFLNDVYMVDSDRKKMKISKKLIVNSSLDCNDILSDENYVFDFPKLSINI